MDAPDPAELAPRHPNDAEAGKRWAGLPPPLTSSTGMPGWSPRPRIAWRGAAASRQLLQKVKRAEYSRGAAGCKLRARANGGSRAPRPVALRLAAVLAVLPQLCAGQGLTESELASMTAGLPSRYPRGFMRGWSAGYTAGFDEGRARDKAGQTASRNVGAVTWTHAGPPAEAMGATSTSKVEAGSDALDETISDLAKDYDAALSILRSRAPLTAAMEPSGGELAGRLKQRAGLQKQSQTPPPPM